MLKTEIVSINSLPEIICITEIWLDENYTCILSRKIVDNYDIL